MNEKMKNGNKIIPRTGNEVTGTVRVQVSFCIQVLFLFFLFPVLVARTGQLSLLFLKLVRFYLTMLYIDLNVINFQKHLRLTMDQRQMKNNG